jgi:hypothetical protein
MKFLVGLVLLTGSLAYADSFQLEGAGATGSKPMYGLSIEKDVNIEYLAATGLTTGDQMTSSGLLSYGLHTQDFNVGLFGGAQYKYTNYEYTQSLNGLGGLEIATTWNVSDTFFFRNTNRLVFSPNGMDAWIGFGLGFQF